MSNEPTDEDEEEHVGGETTSILVVGRLSLSPESRKQRQWRL
jgi:hypothetical protein